MKKVIGYLIITIGFILTIFSFAEFREFLKVEMPENIKENTLFIVGLVLLGIGMLISFKLSNQKKPKEVPIYHGKHIVGYRRH